MKKKIILILMVLVFTFAAAQSSEALSLSFESTFYPDGTIIDFWPTALFDGVSHAVIVWNHDGSAYATALLSDGTKDPYYFEAYMDTRGNIYQSSDDGMTWYLFK